MITLRNTCECVCVCVCVLRSEEHTSELQSHLNLVCRLLLEKYRPYVSTPGPLHSTLLSACFNSTAHLARLLVLLRCLPLILVFHCLAVLCFFFNDTATTEIYPLSLHDALPIFQRGCEVFDRCPTKAHLQRTG